MGPNESTDLIRCVFCFLAGWEPKNELNLIKLFFLSRVGTNNKDMDRDLFFQPDRNKRNDMDLDLVLFFSRMGTKDMIWI